MYNNKKRIQIINYEINKIKNGSTGDTFHNVKI